MIRFLVLFLILSLAIHFGITGWRDLTGKERWNLTKSIFYSIIIGLLAIAVLISIVIVF